MGQKRWLRLLLQKRNAIPMAVLLLSLLAYDWVSTQTDLNLQSPQDLKLAIANAGLGGILIYIAVIALSVVLSPIPSAPLAVAAGAVWGAIPAGLYSVIGGFLGSLIAYFIGRTLGRSAVRALTGKALYFSKARGEWLIGGIIFITRLLPVLSFDLISYGAGLTGLSLRIYAPATLLGMIPSTLLLTYMGEAFTIGLPLGIALAIIFVVLLALLPWGIRRYNWFNLRDIVLFE